MFAESRVMKKFLLETEAIRMGIEYCIVPLIIKTDSLMA